MLNLKATVITYDGTHNDALNPDFPFKDGTKLLWLGEIDSMPGHCVVVSPEGRVCWGFHSERFMGAKEPYTKMKLVKRVGLGRPPKIGEVFLFLGKIEGTDDHCAVVTKKGKVLWDLPMVSFEDLGPEDN